MAYAPRVAYLMAPSHWRGVVLAIEGRPKGPTLPDAIAPITYGFAEEGASMASLKDSLDTLRRAAEGDGTRPGRISTDDLTIMHRVTADQRASGFQARMPKPGQPGPAFTLANQDGVDVSSSALVARGPLVISFFRGRW